MDLPQGLFKLAEKSMNLMLSYLLKNVMSHVTIYEYKIILFVFLTGNIVYACLIPATIS